MNKTGRIRTVTAVSALAIAMLLWAGCSTTEKPASVVEQPTVGLPPQGQAGEEVTLSEDWDSEVIPQSVRHYGAGQYVTLSDLRLSKDGQVVSGSVQFERLPAGMNEELGLVVYVATSERLLAIHYSTTQRLLVTTPPGQSGDVTFGMQGYELEGEEAGSIDFEFPTETRGIYNLGGERGIVFVYCVKIHEQNLSLKDVVSNVIKANMSF